MPSATDMRGHLTGGWAAFYQSKQDVGQGAPQLRTYEAGLGVVSYLYHSRSLGIELLWLSFRFWLHFWLQLFWLQGVAKISMYAGNARCVSQFGPSIKRAEAVS